MTNYFLTTTFDSSKIIFLFHLSVHLILVYVLYSFWARETCCCSETWNIWVQFTSPTWNTIMFLRLGGLEKKTCCWRWVKCNCAVIAAVQEEKSSHFRNRRRFQEDVFADSFSFHQRTFTPSINSRIVLVGQILLYYQKCLASQRYTRSVYWYPPKGHLNTPYLACLDTCLLL